MQLFSSQILEGTIDIYTYIEEIQDKNNRCKTPVQYSKYVCILTV